MCIYVYKGGSCLVFESVTMGKCSSHGEKVDKRDSEYDSIQVPLCVAAAHVGCLVVVWLPQEEQKVDAPAPRPSGNISSLLLFGVVEMPRGLKESVIFHFIRSCFFFFPPS